MFGLDARDDAGTARCRKSRFGREGALRRARKRSACASRLEAPQSYRDVASCRNACAAIHRDRIGYQEEEQ